MARIKFPEATDTQYEQVPKWEEYSREFVDKKNIPQIRGKVFHDNVVIHGERFSEIIFENCYFKGHLIFRRANCKRGVTLTNCSLVGDIDFTAENQIDGLVRLNKITAGGISTFNSVIDHIHCTNISCEHIHVFGLTCKSFSIVEDLVEKEWTKNIIDQVFINCQNLQGNITISGYSTYVIGISLTGHLTQGTITLQNCMVDLIDIFQFKNDGRLSIGAVSPDMHIRSILHFQTSHLGKCEFYDFNFQNYASVHIAGTNLGDCVFSDVTWFKRVDSNVLPHIDSGRSVVSIEKRHKNIFYRKFESELSWYKLRDTYRQIKFALTKQGDFANEQKFHSLEMHSYDRMLTWRQNFWIKLILRLSYLTSDFGQSILRPFVSLIAVHTVLYVFVIMFTPLGSGTLLTAAGWSKAAHDYMLLIIPLRAYSSEFEGWTIFLDILMRIWSSYMLYNIIRASRRFIK